MIDDVVRLTRLREDPVLADETGYLLAIVLIRQSVECRQISQCVQIVVFGIDRAQFSFAFRLSVGLRLSAGYR